MSKIILGIDPGAAGGVCVYDNGKITAHKMPETYPDIYLLLDEIKSAYRQKEVAAFLEDVGHGMPGQSSSATAKFARHNGHLEMALYALGIPTTKVTPQKWQRSFSNSLGKSSEHDKREWKNKLKGLAQQLFPTEKVTLNNADAILIAVYGAKNTPPSQ